MRRLMVLLTLVIPLSAGAQITFERTYGGPHEDCAQWAAQTVDGGYIVTGWTGDVDLCADILPADVYLIKTDEWGDTVWTRTYGGPQEDAAAQVVQTDDEGYVIVGWTHSYGAGGSDVYLVKTDSSGDTLWTRSYGSSGYETGGSVAQTVDDGYIIAGATTLGAGGYDLYLVKTDESGDTVWTRTYGGSDFEWGSSVAPTVDGGYIIGGSTESYGAGLSDLYLIKTDANGDTVWTRTYGGWGMELARSVGPTLDGGYIIAGYTSSFGAGGADVWILKTDSSGDTAWTRTYGWSSYDAGESAAQTLDGGYIITGTGKPPSTDFGELYLIRTDGAGDTVWTRTYGGPESESGNSVAQTLDGGYVIAGYTYSFGAGAEDMYLVKTDAGGMLEVSDDRYETPPSRCSYLAQNCPNPFRGATTIAYALPNPLRVCLAIYDVRGALVRELVRETAGAGVHQLVWDGRDGRGREAASGVYFCHLSTDEQVQTKRMVLLR